MSEIWFFLGYLFCAFIAYGIAQAMWYREFDEYGFTPLLLVILGPIGIIVAVCMSLGQDCKIGFHTGFNVVRFYRKHFGRPVQLKDLLKDLKGKKV